MRAAQNQASNAANTAGSTAAGYGMGAENISSVLTPFLTRELNNPEGISQPDQTAMLSNGLAGAGGLAGGLETRSNERAAATGNASGFASSADDIARERMKAAAGESSNVATMNAHEKLNQKEEAAGGLRGMYGTDVNAQLGAMGVQNNAINTEINAGSHGWFQNMVGLIAAVRGGGQPGGASSGASSGGGGGEDPNNFEGSGMSEEDMLALGAG